MRLHLLLTPELLEKIPETAKITNEWGDLTVIFGDGDFERRGLHCFVEDTKENFVNWLHQFDGVVIGNGSPMTEQFSIMHIDDELFEEINK